MQLIEKKSLLISLFMGLLFTLIVMIPGFQVNAAEKEIRDTSKVQLYYNDVQYGPYAWAGCNIYIKVSRELKNPFVTVEHKSADNRYELMTCNAKFVENLDNNYAIYDADISSEVFADYTIIVKSDNGTYIDDNDGKHYSRKEILGAANVAAVRSNYVDTNKREINAVVKNLAYNKEVKVRYTEDGWKTYKDAFLTYNYTLDDGTEAWRTVVDYNSANYKEFQYAISYTVNGQTYWDNNFGKNYSSYSNIDR